MMNGMDMELAEKVHLLFMANYIDYSHYGFRDEEQVDEYSISVHFLRREENGTKRSTPPYQTIPRGMT